MDEIKKLPNKVLLWCGEISVAVHNNVNFACLDCGATQLRFCLVGTRSSNLLRHLKKGFLPATCSLPVPGYMVKSINHQQKYFSIILKSNKMGCFGSLARHLFVLMLLQKLLDMVLLL